LLVRGVNWLGDAIMSSSALLRLREARPNAELFLLTPEKLADLWKGHPAVDQVLTFAPDDSVWRVRKLLRQHQFHIALILPNSPRSALESFLARIPRRIGYTGRGRTLLLTQPIARRADEVVMRKRTISEVRSLLRQRSNPERVPVPASAHHVHQYLHLAAALGADPRPLPPHVAVSNAEVTDALLRFGLKSLADQPLFGLNPGAEYGPAKRWPAERFIEAAVRVRSLRGGRWIVFGGKADLELAKQIAEGIASADVTPADAVTNVAGRTSLRELCALLKACDVVLTNDTGPMHLAAAVGTPVVVPFGSTSPDLTGPGLPGLDSHRLIRSHAACSPCFLRECPIDFRCMHGITIERVVDEVLAAAP
jgi:heptosyltransferase-2